MPLNHTADKARAFCAAFNIDSLGDLHPNTAEFVQQRLLPLDADRFAMLLSLAERARDGGADPVALTDMVVDDVTGLEAMTGGGAE